MMKDSVGLVLLIAVPVITSALLHYFRSKYFDASVLAALLAALIFIGIDYIDGGYVSSFFPIVLLTGTLYSLAVALAVGILFLVYRRRHSTHVEQEKQLS